MLFPRCERIGIGGINEKGTTDACCRPSFLESDH
jgi:hypothetical protein